MKDLSKHFKISPSTATGIVDRLVDYKYVIRKRSKDDRRKVILIAAEKAIKLHQSHSEMLLKEINPLLSDLPTAKKNLLFNSLRNINSIIKPIGKRN